MLNRRILVLAIIAASFIVLGTSARAQTASPAGCAAIIARPNQQLGGANLTGFTPWGGQSDWTRDISADAIDPYSAAWVSSVKGDGNPFLMPDQVVNTVVVTAGQTRVATPLTGYPSVSDFGPYPIPLPPLIQGSNGGTSYATTGDRHLTIIDKDSCLLYEIYSTSYDPVTKAISASNAAIYDLLSGDHQRPYLWTGGSVAGVPWSYHALRYDEVASGEIKHALTFAARNAWGRSAFTGVANSHQYGMGNNAVLPPFGARARLKPDFDVSSFSPRMQVVLNALKHYGMIYIDGGYPIDLHVEVDDRWDMQELNQLRNVFFAGNFDFVQAGPIYADPMYGIASMPPKGPAPVIDSFTASSFSVPAGSAVTLNWSVSGAGSRVRIITPDVGPMVGDSVVVTPAATTTYTLSVENTYGVSRKTVTVNVAGSCVAGLPAITLSPASQTVNAGEPSSVLVTITNTDSSDCAPERFTLSHTLPQGWSGIYSDPAPTIAPGASGSATLQLTSPNDGKRGDTPITAAVSGMAGTASQTTNIFFVPPQSLSLSLAATSIVAGKSTTVTASLANPAPAGGATILVSTSGATATAPVSVVIPAGSSSVKFTVNTAPLLSTAYLTVSASYGDMARSVNLRLDPAKLWFFGIAKTTMTPGTTTAGNNCFMTGPVAVDTIVAMTSSDPAASVQPTVLIKAGTSQSSFSITANSPATTTKVMITASSNGVSYSANLTVQPTVTASLTIPATIVGGTTSSESSVALSAPAATDTKIQLSSGSALATVPTEVVIPAGSSSAQFSISTSLVSAATDVSITAVYGVATTTKAVTLSPYPVSSLSLLPSPVQGGASPASNTVSLAGPAGPDGAVIALTSADPSLVSVPPTVTIPAGATKSGNFTVKTFGVSTVTSVAVTASYAGTAQTAAITLNPAGISTLWLSPNPAVGGATTAYNSVILTGPAGASGATATLVSSDPSLAVVPSTVTVAAGATSGSFSITTTSVSAPTTVTITATYGGISKTSVLTLNPPALSLLAIAPTTLPGGNQSVYNAVLLNGPAGPAGAPITLTSLNPDLASVPATVTVAPGQAKASFTITSSVVTTPTTVAITASYGTISKTSTLTLTPAALSSVYWPTSITSGTSKSVLLTLDGPAGPDGTVVAFTSSSASLSVPATVAVPPGATYTRFTMTAVQPLSPQAASDEVVTVAAQCGKTVSTTITVAAPAP